MSNQSGVLYVVATPIGNLEDMTERARRLLAEVDLIAAEDTRHSRKLLQHLGVNTPMRAYHDHNERTAAADIIEQITRGRDVALIADAGTPLIQDPGYQLVKRAHQLGIRVVPVPGASALTAALSVAGLATDRFVFEGFLPEKQGARQKRLQALARQSRTMVFYEAPHRILAFMQDSVAVFGADREACLARELSKYYETINNDTLEGLYHGLQSEQIPCKGEFVIVIQGNTGVQGPGEEEVERILKILLQTVPLKQAAAIAAEITGLKKNDLYKLALSLKEDL